ncbi:MAG: glycine zipper family protein [Rhodoferax sp.]
MAPVTAIPSARASRAARGNAIGGLAWSALLVAGCAATGPHSPSARPVIYSAAAPTAAAQAQQQAATDDCIGRAQAQGLTPDEKNNETGRRAAQGAATGGVAAAVGALVTGRNVDGVVRAGAAGAAVGGSAGAVSGAMSERPSATYRNYVQRCLGDKGFQVIGWN